MNSNSASAQAQMTWRLDLLWGAVAVATLLVLTKVVLTWQAPVDNLARMAGDEVMRLEFVREWLAGASWFDTTIDRAAPPDGLSLHWSRYVDVPMAGMILVLSTFLPPETAEAISIVLWPTLLLVAFIAVSATAAKRLFGRTAAAAAIFGVILWEATANVRFGPMRLDHHGFQILLMAVVILTLVSKDGGRRAGLLGGLAAALSLAVGLEMLTSVALAGTILFVRCILSPQKGSAQLAAFGPALALGSIVLFLGQTPPAEWAARRCDELAGSILTLVGAGAVAALVMSLLAGRVSNVGSRALLGIGVAAGAMLASFPALGPCFEGPYGNLPEDLQHLITSNITEARPVFAYIGIGKDIFYGYILPAVMTLLIATAILLRGALTGKGQSDQLYAVAILLCFAWLGVLLSGLQFRLLVIAEPIIPILMGYVVATLAAARTARPGSSLSGLALVFGVAVTLLPGQLHQGVERLVGAEDRTGGPAAEGLVDKRSCREAEIIRSLQSLPPSRLMPLGNLARPVLLLTDHDILVAPYHRSELLMRNLALFYEREEAAVHTALRESGADYLVLCRNAHHWDGKSFVDSLAAGAVSEGLTPVDGLHPALAVFRVDLQ